MMGVHTTRAAQAAKTARATSAGRRRLFAVGRQSRGPAVRGFSLIELMVVLVILGLLAGLVGPRLFGRVESAKVKTADTQVRMLRGALQTYRLDVGQYPTSDQGLNALMQAPPEVAEYWDGPYLEEDIPLDPWRTAYVYQFPADNLQGFALYSLGADATQGGEGANADVGFLPDRG